MNLQKTITVRGTGRAKAKPDCIHLGFGIHAHHADFQAAMAMAEESLAKLKSSLGHLGISDDELKTSDFGAYHHEKDHYHDTPWHEVWHRFHLVLDLDLVFLGRVLEAITSSASKPNISVQFGVRDARALQDAILADAAANARHSAEVLCRACGASLGELLSINHSWQELDVYSGSGCAASPPPAGASTFTPEDVEGEDSATFTWSLATP